MIVGVPREIKDREFRVGVVPAGVRAFTAAGHTVVVESGAGEGSGFSDREYRQAGADVTGLASDVYSRAEMIVKVKEPLSEEYRLLREGLILFTYLHLAPLPELTDVLLGKKIIGVAYETVQLTDGSLPLLTPMSEVAGRLAVQAGARFLEKSAGGRGVLLAGVPGVEPGHVAILGSGTVAENAARIATAMGATVTILGRNLRRLAELDALYGGRLRTLASNRENIDAELRKADLVVGAVLLPGASAPKLITREMLALMKKGSVIVDVSIDQGGCVETARPTTHSNPTFEVDGIIHYCVANMPGAVPRTSTYALTNATLPYALQIANSGIKAAVSANSALKRGVNVYLGHLVNPEVGESQQKKWIPLPS